MRIQQAQHERFDDFALEHAGSVAEQPEPIDRPRMCGSGGDEVTVHSCSAMDLLEEAAHGDTSIVICELLDSVEDFSRRNIVAGSRYEPVVEED